MEFHSEKTPSFKKTTGIITRLFLVVLGLFAAWAMTPRKTEEKKCLSYPAEHLTASSQEGVKTKVERKW